MNNTTTREDEQTCRICKKPCNSVINNSCCTVCASWLDKWYDAMWLKKDVAVIGGNFFEIDKTESRTSLLIEYSDGRTVKGSLVNKGTVPKAWAMLGFEDNAVLVEIK